MCELNFPKHKASLTLVHNDHKDYYSTVKDEVENNSHGYTNWVSDEQKKKAIETDDCWYIQWYPQTPVSCYIVSAADLDVLLKYVNIEEIF